MSDESSPDVPLNLDRCPRCGGMMESGFIIPTGAVRWDTEMHSTFPRGEDLVGQHPAWRAFNRPAQRCVTCKLAIFRYLEEGELTRDGPAL